jgi:hypothetical protein
MDEIFKFKVYTFSKRIEKVKVFKESEFFVWISPDCREKKITENVGYFDTFIEAKQFLIRYFEDQIERMESDKKRYKDRIEELKLIEYKEG